MDILSHFNFVSHDPVICAVLAGWRWTDDFLIYMYVVCLLLWMYLHAWLEIRHRAEIFSKSCIIQPIASVWSIFALTLSPSSHWGYVHNDMRVSDCTMPTFIPYHFSPLSRYFLYHCNLCVMNRTETGVVYASDNALSEKTAYQV